MVLLSSIRWVATLKQSDIGALEIIAVFENICSIITDVRLLATGFGSIQPKRKPNCSEFKVCTPFDIWACVVCRGNIGLVRLRGAHSKPSWKREGGKRSFFD